MHTPPSPAITIRRAEPGDAAAVQRIFAGRKVMHGTLQLPFPSVELWRKRLSEPVDGLHLLVACAADEIVGQLGVQTFPHQPRRRHVGELGMAVHDDWQGKGVGKAMLRAAIDLAENWLQVSRLELQVYTDNEPAVQLYQKCGFVIEGTLLQYAFRDGAFVDVYAMARLRPR